MNITLKVQPDVLTAKSSEITVEKNSILATLDQVKSEMNTLVNIWKSQAADEYQARFKQLYNDMENVISILTEYISDLSESATVYIGAETAAKNMIEGLPVDGVFKS